MTIDNGGYQAMKNCLVDENVLQNDEQVLRNSEVNPTEVCEKHFNTNNSNKRSRHNRSVSDSAIIENKNFNFRNEVCAKATIADKPKAVKSNSHQSYCQKQSFQIDNINTNNSSNREQIKPSEGDVYYTTTPNPPQYTSAVVVNYSHPDPPPTHRSGNCVISTGAVIVVIVLIAIIACLVVALTVFLISGKTTESNEPTSTSSPTVSKIINQTTTCGIFPDIYKSDKTRERGLDLDDLLPSFNNGTERIVGGEGTSIKLYPWQITQPSYINNYGRRPSVRPRVLGGSNTRVGKLPWQASLWVEGRGQTCGGAIVLSNWVITAAHCTVTSLEASAWVVYLGVTNINNKDKPPTQKRKVTLIVQHPKYVDDDSYDYDISLLKLDKPLEFTDSIQPACIPSKGKVFRNGTSCFVSGWGAIDSSAASDPPSELQHAQIDLFDRSTCVRWLGNFVTERMICAGKEDGSSDACQGDSGGPLSCYSLDTDAWVLVGIVSWGIECGLEQLPGVYTHVSFFTDWIWENIGQTDGF